MTPPFTPVDLSEDLKLALFARLEGEVTPQEIVGESFCQELLGRIAASHAGEKMIVFVAVLLPEPSNPHDPNAIQVFAADVRRGNIGKIGYIPREVAPKILKIVTAVYGVGGRWPAFLAELRGGTAEAPMYGVVLQLDLDAVVEAVNE